MSPQDDIAPRISRNRAPRVVALVMCFLLVLAFASLPDDSVQGFFGRLFGDSRSTASQPRLHGYLASGVVSDEDEAIFSKEDRMPSRVANLIEGLGSTSQVFALYGGSGTHIVILSPAMSAAYVRSAGTTESATRTLLTTAAAEAFARYISVQKIDTLSNLNKTPEDSDAPDYTSYGYLHYTAQDRTSTLFKLTDELSPDGRQPAVLRPYRELLTAFRALHPLIKDWSKFGMEDPPEPPRPITDPGVKKRKSSWWPFGRETDVSGRHKLTDTKTK